MSANEPPDGTADLAKLRSRVVLGGLATFGSQGVRFVVKLAAQIVVARLLTPADYGVVAMVFPVLSLVLIISTVGLGQATIIDTRASHADISALFWLSLALNVAIGAVLALASPLLGLLYRNDNVVPVAVALSLMIPLAGLATQPQAMLSRNLRFQSMALMDVAPPLFALIAAYFAAAAGWKYWALVLSTATETGLTVLIVWSLAGWTPAPPKFGRAPWSLIKVGGNLTINNLANYVTTSADRVLLGVASGQVALGLYDKGYKIVTQPIGQMTLPLNRIAVPLLVRLRDNEALYRRAFMGMLELLMVAGVPGILYVMVDARPLMTLALGDKWSAIGSIVSWLCVGALASCPYTALSWLFTSQNRTHEQLRVGMVVTVVSLIGFVAGLPWGAVGVAEGAGISFLFVAVPYGCWAAARRGPVRLADLARSLWPIGLAGAASVAAVLAASHLRLGIGSLGLLVDAVVSYGSFGLVIVALPEGRRIVRDLWALRTAVRPASK